jgi:hypothetical protein
MLRYLGPETAMPLASLLAIISGALILFWRRTVDLARSIGRFVGRLFGRNG